MTHGCLAPFRRRFLLVAALGAAALSGCRSGDRSTALLAYSQGQTRADSQLSVQSSAFGPGEAIPGRYANYGENLSPPLSWSKLPEKTKSVVVIMEDPDAPAPNKPYVHWVLYDLPEKTTEMPSGVSARPRLESMGGATHGRNSAGTVGYFGPRPPEGDKPHRYYFQVYALDRRLDLEPGAGRDQVLQRMKGRVLAKGRLMGTYQKR